MSFLKKEGYYAYSFGVGKFLHLEVQFEVVVGIKTFPLSRSRHKNYPLFYIS
jgi:hypothetical protein